MYSNVYSLYRHSVIRPAFSKSSGWQYMYIPNVKGYLTAIKLPEYYIHHLTLHGCMYMDVCDFFFQLNWCYKLAEGLS